MVHCYLKVVGVAVYLMGNCSGAIAQTAPASGPRKVTVYLTAKGQQLPSSEGADHQAEITMRDSVSGIMREFYPSGKSWRIIQFAHVERGIKHGVEMSFAESGNMLTRQEFVAGQAEGDLVAYYPTGTVKSRTPFLHGQQQSKNCFTATGVARNCPPDDTAPIYPGGESALINDIVSKVRHSRGALHKTVNGQDMVLRLAVVRVRLAVDSLGMVTSTEVLYTPMDSWSAAVLKVLPRLQHFSPAYRDGLAVADTVEVSLTFPLED